MSISGRIHLSIADVGQLEMDSIRSAIGSGWVTTTGPDLTQFEIEIAKVTKRKCAVALSSGTAALHLAYKVAGIGSDDEVIVPSMTFAATAFPITYLGAKPVFVDINPKTLTIDVELLHDLLKSRKSRGLLPKAIVPVDLYGMPCDYSALGAVSKEFEISLICDAAESLGSEYKGRPAGSFGDSAVLSFNGNKIITTSGGGMFLTDNLELANKVRYWASQAREQVPWYEHKDIGFNYRLSNVLAALGRAQLTRLPEFVSHRRNVRSWYSEALNGIPGVSILQDPPWGNSNAWLTIAMFDEKRYPDAPRIIREVLESNNIESRNLWKPLDMQPIFRRHEAVLTGVSESAFRNGICLPSGISVDQETLHRVCSLILRALKIN
jgi:dTDP-4-amino-4,6-dideoxygalactose transaminase